MTNRMLFGAAALWAVLSTQQTQAQSAPNLAVLKGLAPVSALSNSRTGKVALADNYTVTVGIQTGTIRQPTLLPFAEQQEQALRDAFITAGNLAQLADGLGTTLGAAYEARAHYLDRARFTSLSLSVASLIAYANATTRSDSDAAKYFFGNGTTDGRTPVSSEAAAIFTSVGGAPDIFGRSYEPSAVSLGADTYGNPRPFQIATIARFAGRDYFDVPSDNAAYNRGPVMNLLDSPSYPSGHTTYGYMGAIILAVLMPERYPQMMARAAEYGNDRILMGAHYAMDILAARTLASFDLAHLLANDPTYVGRSLRGAPVITDFRAAIKQARGDMISVLETACGNTIAACSREDTGRLSSPAANRAFYAVTQTYNLPVVHPKAAGVAEDIGKLAPEAGYLLTIAFPFLTLEQADQILTDTEGPGGGFLDDGSGFGVYSRLNLFAAAIRAEAMTASR